ncbi:MAG: endonuclease/exonuclease/phosphatase family protein [Planctomycetota bacterium]
MERHRSPDWSTLASVTLALAVLASVATARQPGDGEVALRVATFNVEDVRTTDLLSGDQPRVRRLAEVLQRLRPTIVLINEIAYDASGVPGTPADESPGGNGGRFARRYLGVPQAEGLAPLRYRAIMLPTNTGMASGLDLDKSGEAVTSYPPPREAGSSGAVVGQTEAGRAYGNDAWGFGTFPGQYGMALLVDERLEVLEDQIRTFRLLPWSAMPDARRPHEDGAPWHDDAVWDAMRLSSKSHWDVPVRLPNGSVVHLLCSHPTPPAFDGPEGRNRARNHDEIRFWEDYLDHRSWIADDRGRTGGLEPGRHFVMLGDLNADPDEGAAVGGAIERLLAHPRVAAAAAPRMDSAIEGLDADDTARFGLRVDYVLPSQGLELLRSGVWTNMPPARGGSTGFPSDHFPVWVDVAVPGGR